jgi:serine/threonine protein kinase
MTVMPDDISLEAFVDALRRSALLDEADLNRRAAQARTSSASDFADSLIRAGELTHYQAEKLLGRRWQGLVIGPYSVLAPLGRGGMGTVVYLARDRRLSESLGDTVLVALKVLPDRKAVEDPKTLARFRREMELGRRVNHPNVVRTCAAGDINDVHFLALEFVPGKTLRQYVAQNGPLKVGEAARIFADVAAGLEHVHARGLVHRDVKPANVMVRPDGRAVLLDLGLAYAPGEPLPADPAIAGGRGYVVGTMDYLAPEQAKNAVGVGPAADLYGLGCTLYFALTGEVPYPAEGVKLKVRRHRHDPIPRVEDVPKEFARFVERLMAKSPEDRPASAGIVREWLLPYATASEQGSSADVLAAADAPGLDAGLWDAAPGEALPEAEVFPGSNPFAKMDDSGTDEVRERYSAPAASSLALIIGGLLFLAILLILFVAMLRQL